MVFNWRKKIIDLLSSPIDVDPTDVPEGQGQEVENPEAEYYAEALKAQGEGKSGSKTLMGFNELKINSGGISYCVRRSCC